MVRFHKPFRWPHEDAFLSNNAIGRRLRETEMWVSLFQKHYPAILIMMTIAGKEKGDVDVCRKVNEIGAVPPKVL